MKPLFYIGDTFDPFANLATELVLLDAVEPGECILYLWQNLNTIVIGRNQNPWKECCVAEFERDGGHLVRRQSGGGAVFHDAGNLNFTFLACQDNHDIARNLGVVCEAVRSFGLDACVSGRNDVEIAGAKFSGNAFFHKKLRHCHHGTLMVDVDTSLLARYLTPDPRKYTARGVDSVRARVVNLRDLASRITVATLSVALIEAFSQVCGFPALPLPAGRIDAQAYAGYEDCLSSWEWRFGQARAFTHRFGERFAWGGIDIGLVVEGGTVACAQPYSDALDADYVAALGKALKGCRYDLASLAQRLGATPATTPEQRLMRSDCLRMIAKELK